MSTRLTLALVAALLAAAPAAAQEDPGAHVYLAYFKIGYNDLPAYLELHDRVEVPLLNELVEEGVLTGFGLQTHNTGGEYNLRLAVRSNDWASLGDFWSKYLARFAERHPAEFARSNEMIVAHTDEVWDISRSNVPQGAPVRYLYDSKFQVRFSQMDAWNAAWNEHLIPLMDKAIADGLLGGWVIEEHNTGGPDNWKVLYLFESWDTMDDFFAAFLPAAMSNQTLLGLMGSAMQSHDDIIWETPQPPGN